MYILRIGTKFATTNENITVIVCRFGVIIEAAQWFVLDRLDVTRLCLAFALKVLGGPIVQQILK
jgi:hypothetical protein